MGEEGAEKLVAFSEEREEQCHNELDLSQETNKQKECSSDFIKPKRASLLALPPFYVPHQTA